MSRWASCTISLSSPDHSFPKKILKTEGVTLTTITPQSLVKNVVTNIVTHVSCSLSYNCIITQLNSNINILEEILLNDNVKNWLINI